MKFKIIDDFDLKKLKEFGFIKYQSIKDGEEYYCICKLFIGKDRIIRQDDECNPCRSREFSLTEEEVAVIFDLIQAGLVEKVED